MIKYFCDRCGVLISDHQAKFTVKIEPPSYYTVFDFDPDKNRYEKPMHLCDVCMGKVIECIDELGRNE